MLEVFQKGGFLMYPIFFCSLIAITIFFERMFYLRSIRAKSKRFVTRIYDLVKKGSIELAISACRKNPIPISMIMLSGLTRYSQTREEIKEAIEDSANQEIPALEKHLSTLSTIGNISPLLGLLGTVFGMIKAFNVISVMGVGKPEVLAGGISEALLTTAFGLSVAIPTIVVYNYLSNRVDKLVKEMEITCVDLLDLLTNYSNREMEGYKLEQEVETKE